ncbi:MATE family efflux transporter [Streptococcus ovuberis]|uniref:Probable multidrug resistance protein NorM n=1 Tax=Streptococcus ovuberis TaxID=1936207 RepID=A0A7X6MYP1_9STRE|nr:MATE family efflux transporter [Streptococcus ovuberis]NKZ20860.1 MATE family efflux transporter [Streptococcus ovuberis]
MIFRGFSPFQTMLYHRKILSVALPVLVENLLQSLMGLVDTYLIAQLGVAVVSGVAIANNVLAVFQAVFIALGAVVSATLAKQNCKDDMRLREAMQVSITLTFLLGGVFGLIGLIGGYELLRLLGARLQVLQNGYSYLAYVGGSIVLLGLMTTFSAMLRILGKTRVPMIASFMVNLLNIFLSIIGVYVLKWGVVGVALGTVLARLLGVVWLWFQIPIKPNFLPKFDKLIFLQVFPATGERLMMRLGDLVVIGLIANLGAPVLAGYAIGETLTQFNYLPGLSVAVATVILTASLQDDPKALQRLLKEAYCMSCGLMFVLALLVLVASPWLMSLYTKNLEVTRSGTEVILASLIGTPFTTGTLIMTAFWQGLGQAQQPFYATALGMWLLRIGLSMVLLYFVQAGLWSILFATIIDNAFRWGYLTYLYLLKRRTTFVKTR